MQKNRGNNKYHNVLVARFSALGDVAMTIPVVYSVCVGNPDTRFIMITQKVASTLFINTPPNLIVIGVDTKTYYHGIRGIFRLKSELVKQYDIDLFIDLHDVLRTWILSVSFLLSGIKVLRFKKGRHGKYELTRKHNKHMLPLISSRARYREVFYRAGFATGDLFMSIFGNQKAESNLYSSITTPKQPDDLWIAIAPFAKHQGKIYPLQSMQKVVETVAKWPHVTVFLMGAGRDESDTFEKWAANHENVKNLAARRNGFPSELALLSNCDVMVSMDSANMHLASLVRLPVVSVWGATHPYCGFLGWHQEERNAVQLNLSCRPCSVFGNKPCLRGDYFCLTGIQPQMIIDHIRQALAERGIIV